MEQILTARLLLVAATREIAQAELAADQKFGALLRAEIPPGWPPPLNDQESLNWFFKLIDHPGYLPGWGSGKSWLRADRSRRGKWDHLLRAEGRRTAERRRAQAAHPAADSGCVTGARGCVLLKRPRL